MILAKSSPSNLAPELFPGFINHDALIDILQRAHSRRRSAGPSVKRGTRGTQILDDVLSGLRDHLIPGGWREEWDGGHPHFVSPDGLHRVQVMTGEESEDLLVPTRNRNPKGPHTSSRVRSNQRLLGLAPPVTLPGIPEPSALTRILLLVIDSDGISAELITPTSIAGGLVTDAIDRISIQASGLNSVENEAKVEPRTAEDSDDVVEVHVTRRAT